MKEKGRVVEQERKIVLSVAGSDCSGGAGIQADIKTIMALGGYAAAAITAVTVQNTLGVKSVFPVPAEVVGQQMEAVLEDLEPDAVKIGMTGSVEVVREIARVLRLHPVRHVVFDPVMVSTSGHPLMTAETVEAICKELLPIVSLVTPNLQEVEPLVIGGGAFDTGTVGTHLSVSYASSKNEFPSKTKEHSSETAYRLLSPDKRGSQEGVNQDASLQEQSARLIYERYGCACLVKGGHLEGEAMCDVLFDGHELHRLTAPRIHSKNLHGTGCTLSSAIATRLAQGYSLYEAVAQAKRYVTQAIEAGRNLQIGKGNGPLWH